MPRTRLRVMPRTSRATLQQVRARCSRRRSSTASRRPRSDARRVRPGPSVPEGHVPLPPGRRRGRRSTSCSRAGRDQLDLGDREPRAARDGGRPAVRRRARGPRRDRPDGERPHARGLERLDRLRRRLPGVPGERALRRAEPAARPGATGPLARGVRGRPPVPRSQGPGGEAAAADGHTLARRSPRGRHGDPRPSPTRISPACAAAAGRTSPACSRSSSGGPCWNATASATS